ncbi:cytochrome P450 [Lipomyces kononenkoae]|uniref:Cytochrome P450 n=1 Tax=Lipomyces kononenkoae TaxID=34357 RepID=A0ACC3SZS8_LIPKO
MIPEDRQPQLPQGDSSLLSSLSQSLSFHSSPESFLALHGRRSAVKLQKVLEDDVLAHKQTIIRARILNRNVAIVTSRRLCEDILNAGSDERNSTVTTADKGPSIGPDTFAAQPAYHDLMAAFFPAPNILLMDFPDHKIKRELWNEQLSSFPATATPMICDIVKDHLTSWQDNSVIDLYDSMKHLSWRILLGIFLQLQPTEKNYSEIQSLQETLLRGQFSLFPVSISTPFWRSPRAKGIKARAKLQTLLSSRILLQDKQCPFLRPGKVDDEEVASHALLFTSSIAVKALASLLTASLLNLFIMPCEPSLASRIRNETSAVGGTLLNSILLETERLSPPVIGIMRRVQQDIILASPNGEPPVLIPAGWDIWLYFVAAARDNAEYEGANTFQPERFMEPDKTSPGLAFGTGPKTCLGQHISRQIVNAVTTTILETDIHLEGSVDAEGVRGWLGWDSNVSVEAFARDLKQLPCQRPKEPIELQIRRSRSGGE